MEEYKNYSADNAENKIKLVTLYWYDLELALGAGDNKIREMFCRSNNFAKAGIINFCKVLSKLKLDYSKIINSIINDLVFCVNDSGDLIVNWIQINKDQIHNRWDIKTNLHNFDQILSCIKQYCDVNLPKSHFLQYSNNNYLWLKIPNNIYTDFTETSNTFDLLFALWFHGSYILFEDSNNKIFLNLDYWYSWFCRFCI